MVVAKPKNFKFRSRASLILCRGFFRRLRQPSNYIMVRWLCNRYLPFCFPSLKNRISWWSLNMEPSFIWSFQSSIKIDLSPTCGGHGCAWVGQQKYPSRNAFDKLNEPPSTVQISSSNLTNTRHENIRNLAGVSPLGRCWHSQYSTDLWLVLN